MEGNMDNLLTAQDVKYILKCSLSYVYSLANRKQIPSVRMEVQGEKTNKDRHLLRFKKNDILDFIAQNYNL